MKLNPKLTGALAWGGLVIILAVPAADMVTNPRASSASVVTSDMNQVRPAATAATKAPVAVKVPVGADPVDEYVASGKKMPSYISDAPAEVAATKPAPAVKLQVPSLPAKTPAASTASPAAQPMEVASIDPATTVVAPEPYPASKRPRPAAVTTASTPSVPVVTNQPGLRTSPVGTPQPGLTGQPRLPSQQPPAASTEAPLIVDEDAVARREAAVSRVLESEPITSTPRRIESDRLEEWDSGSLADYLERRGLINDAPAPAPVQSQAYDPEYDEDGFFLDEGPNRAERRVIRRLPRDDFFF